MKGNNLRKKLCIAGMVVASAFVGIAAPLVVSNVNVEDVQAAVTYPVYVKRNIVDSGDDGWQWLSKDPSYLNNTDIKVYRLSFDRFKGIIDEERGDTDGQIITNMTVPIQTKMLSEAKFCDKWPASESNHKVNLSDGDYFITVSDSLEGFFGPDQYFRISNNGKKVQVYKDASSGYKYVTMETVYEEGKTGTSRTLSVNVRMRSMYASYVDPDIVIRDPSGKNITEKCEIEIYKKNGQKLEKNLTLRREDSIQQGAYSYAESNVPYGSAIVAYLSHPAQHVIRCIKVPEEYKKFNDITISAESTDRGWPNVSVYNANNENVAMNTRQYYHWRKSTPGRVEITLKKAVMPEKVQISKNLLVLDKGKTGKLTATVSPNNTDNKTVTWSSSNTKVAKVDSTGKVTAVNHGTAKITAKTSNGKTTTSEVRVNFIDVTNAKDWYYKPVYWAAEKGITTGTDGKFFPASSCTREQAVTFLWRMAGKPEPKSMVSKYSDVKDTKRYSYKAIMWGTEKGVITGTKGKFYPTGTCTREQIVTMIWRLAGKPEPKNMNSKFKDVTSKTRYSYKAVMWAAEKGITTGTNGLFYPTGQCKRREIVTFIYRYKN